MVSIIINYRQHQYKSFGAIYKKRTPSATTFHLEFMTHIHNPTPNSTLDPSPIPNQIVSSWSENHV